MYIYLIENEVTKKKYVGQTVRNPKQRMLEHRRHSRYANEHKGLLARAINKHGWESFKWHILAECSDQDSLNASECFWIAELNSMSPNGYNLDPGGKAKSEKSAETRKKLSEAATGKVASKETRAKISAAAKGRKASSEARSRMSKSQTGRKHKPETLAKISAGNKGKVVSAEGRANMVEAFKSRPPPSLETRAKLSRALAGRPRSPEVQAKMQETRTGRVFSPETKAKISAAQAAFQAKKRLEASSVRT